MGYIQSRHYGVGLDVLSKQFSHSDSSITRRCLGITGKVVRVTIMIDIWQPARKQAHAPKQAIRRMGFGA